MARFKHPEYSVDVVGHSLGGAIAQMMAPWLRDRGVKCDMYSFSAPRSGDLSFARYASELRGAGGHNYRVTHLEDWVPKVPPLPFFVHVKDEYFITSAYGVAPRLADIRFFKGFEIVDYRGGNAWTWMTDFSFRSHSWIFDNITQCSPFVFGLGSIFPDASQMPPPPSSAALPDYGLTLHDDA